VRRQSASRVDKSNFVKKTEADVLSTQVTIPSPKNKEKKEEKSPAKLLINAKVKE
jgi:hypothetical protein